MKTPFPPPPPGEGEVCWGRISICEERIEYQVVKRGKEYQDCGEGDGNLREEIKYVKKTLKKRGWGRISSCMELYKPLH